MGTLGERPVRILFLALVLQKKNDACDCLCQGCTTYSVCENITVFFWPFRLHRNKPQYSHYIGRKTIITAWGHMSPITQPPTVSRLKRHDSLLLNEWLKLSKSLPNDQFNATNQNEKKVNCILFFYIRWNLLYLEDREHSSLIIFRVHNKPRRLLGGIFGGAGWQQSKPSKKLSAQIPAWWLDPSVIVHLRPRSNANPNASLHFCQGWRLNKTQTSVAK